MYDNLTFYHFLVTLILIVMLKVTGLAQLIPSKCLTYLKYYLVFALGIVIFTELFKGILSLFKRRKKENVDESIHFQQLSSRSSFTRCSSV